MSGLTVLLVGKGARRAPVLQKHLLKRGCDIFFATSRKEASELLQRRRFDLVLCEFILSDGTAYQLMTLLLGTDTTMFVSNAVEDGCWWMTAVLKGQDRSHEPGMRPAQFTRRLDQILFDKLFRAQNSLPTYQGKNAQADFEAINGSSPHDHASSPSMRQPSGVQGHAKS